MDRYDVLRFLQAQEDFLSGEEMAQRMGVSRAAVWKWIKQLKEEGYAIQSVTKRGYRLAGGDVLSEFELRRLLRTQRLGRQLWVLPSVSSTNNFLKLQAEQQAPDGAVVLSDTQEQGRGRRGRSFYSPAGEGLYLSVLLHPKLLLGEVGLLTAAIALAVADTVQAFTGIRPQIKWPNDLLYQGRKLCGILTETSVESESGQVLYAVCGVGINVNNRSFPSPVADQAVSLYQMGGKFLSRTQLAASLLERLEDLYLQETYRTQRETLLEQYRRDQAVLGRELLILTPAGQEQATGLAIDERGGLVVRMQDGTERTLYTGDLSIRPLGGE